MKKSSSSTGLYVLAAAMVVLLAGARLAEAVTCSPTELSSCSDAILNSTPPPPTCCQKLREQRPCLCGYFKNPTLKPYVTSPGAKKVASTCGVPFPNC